MTAETATQIPSRRAIHRINAGVAGGSARQNMRHEAWTAIRDCYEALDAGDYAAGQLADAIEWADILDRGVAPEHSYFRAEALDAVDRVVKRHGLEVRTEIEHIRAARSAE